MEARSTQARLFLLDRPRVEILLSPGESGTLPVWLVVSLPGPMAADRPEGRFRADPRLPESEVELAWGLAPAVPQPLTVLTVTVGDRSWTLHQDPRHPGRWREQADPDARRHWS